MNIDRFENVALKWQFRTAERKPMMLTLAISLLFAAGAAFALLVIIGMVAGNRRAIRAALLGHGAFGHLQPHGGTVPPSMKFAARIGQGRHRHGPLRPMATKLRGLRAAA